MSRFALLRPSGPRQTFGAGVAALGMAAVVGGALAFQHIGGYIPCPLCLAQRTPYYVAIPIAAVAFLVSRVAPPVVTRTLLLIVGAAMLWAAALGIHHAGVEYGWWAGPADCGVVGGFDLRGGNLLSQLDTVRGPSCDEPALLIFGLSLAVWNAVAALILAAISIRAALSGGDRFSADA